MKDGINFYFVEEYQNVYDICFNQIYESEE